MAANRNNLFFVGESSSRNNNFISGESSGESDNIKWAKEFDEKNLDIKWLADNLPHVPRPFYSQSPLRTMFTEVYNDNPIPIISMQLPEADLVEKIKQASSKFGYFQIIDHGVPLPLCDQLIEKMRSFYDMGLEFRKSWLKRSITYDKGAFYNSTHDIFNGQDPTWHDTLFLRFGPGKYCDPIPEICESQVDAWTSEMRRLSFWIADLFAKGLGRNDRPFSWMLGRMGFYGNFYPRCCDPDPRIVGFQPHTDPCLFSILLQDDSGGLKGLYNKNWYEIRPVRGALVIFVGDLMEILSDGVYESGIHYVKTSTCIRPRVSVLQTFAPGFQNAICTPITQSGVPKFNPVNISMYIKDFFNSIMTIKTMVGRYKIQPPIHGRHQSEPDTELRLGPSGGI